MLYSIDNGSPSVMSADKSSAAAGETVTVTNLTSSALSWTLDGVSQTDIAANGTATFTMPAGNVVVGAPQSFRVYMNSYARVVNNATGVSLEDGQEVTAGEILSVGTSTMATMKANIFFGTSPYDVDYSNPYYGDLTVGGDQGSFSFAMPSSNIYIEVKSEGSGGAG